MANSVNAKIDRLFELSKIIIEKSDVRTMCFAIFMKKVAFNCIFFEKTLQILFYYSNFIALNPTLYGLILNWS